MTRFPSFIFVALLFAALSSALSAALSACRDSARFSSDGDHYEGAIVAGDFVRAGFPSETRLCLTLDARDLQGAPGSLTSTDGRFKTTGLRPIPPLFHDSLSMLEFGQGRERNLVYAAAPRLPSSGSPEADALVVLSLLQNGNVEARILRGAPGAPSDGVSPSSEPLFGVFPLERKAGPCSF